MPDLQIIHQTGKADYANVKAAYSELNVDVEVAPFFDDMSQLYQRSTFALARCGAMTLSELAAFGIPAILIPYPHAVDDHQAKNAQVFVDAGGAIMYRQDVKKADLAHHVGDLLVDGPARTLMADNMRAAGRPDAGEVVAEIAMRIANCSITDKSFM